LNSPHYLRDPGRRIWAPWHLVGDSRWTVEGRVARRRLLIHLAIGLLLGLMAAAVVLFVEETRQ
jgi:hypothetical protein